MNKKTPKTSQLFLPYRKLALVGKFLSKFSSLSAPTKIEELTAGSDEKKTQRSPAGNRTHDPGFDSRRGCAVFYLCRRWERREFDLPTLLCLCLCFSLPQSLSTHTYKHIYTQAHAQKKHTSCTKHTCITHHHHHQYPCTHARTHTQHKRPKRTNRNRKQIPCAPQKPTQVLSSSVLLQLLFYLHRTVHLFMLLTISGETMCGGHQRTLSNRRLPSSQSKPTAVHRPKDFSMNYGKHLPEPPKSNKKEKLKKESVRCLHVVSPKPAFACKHAPAHLSTRQSTSVGRPCTSTPSAPHVHTNFAWFQSYSTRNLRTRSGHPPEVASQLMHPFSFFDLRLTAY